jgi:hypothetical protein
MRLAEKLDWKGLKQIGCALVGLIKEWITSECTIQLLREKKRYLHLPER